MLLVIFLTGAILWNLPWSKYENVFLVSAVEPGYLDFDNLPDTNFSCEGKVIGGYYADVETGCQMFHVCTIGQKSEITDIKFLCLNGTVFDQETRVCERLDEVDCSKSESFFDLNLELYGNNGGGYGIQPEDENPSHDGDQANCDDEYEDDGSCKKVEPNQKPNVMDIQEEIEYDWEEINSALSTTPASESSSTTQATTTTKPITTSHRPSSTPSANPPKFHYRPEIVPISTTTPNTVLQLLALHEAFQENLKRRDPQLNSKFPPNVSPTQKPSPTKTSSVPHPPYQLSNSPQNHFITNSNKLPNSLPNLSQNVQFSNLAPNRGPPHSTHKAEPVNNFFNKQPSQKVPNKTIANHSPTLASSTNQNVQPLYAYKVLGNDATGVNRYRPPSIQPSKPVVEMYKIETVPQLAHSTFTITQNKPYLLRSKMSLEKDTDSENDEEAEERATLRKLENFSHSNFARAIPDRHSTPKNASDSVSVVLTTSSVSSSISSKPRSAITSNANSVSVSNSLRNSDINNGSSVVLSTKLKEVSPLTFIQPNITDINKSLTDESYYEETRADYDDNAQEYKDILYQTDVQKIKQ